MVSMPFVAIVSLALLVEFALIALLSLIFSTCFFPLCLHFLSRQDESFCLCDASTVSILTFLASLLGFKRYYQD